jgi:protease IV
MKRMGWLLVLLAVPLFTGCISMDVADLLSPELEEVVVQKPERSTSDRILIVDISGVISSGEGGLLGDGENCSPEAVKAVLNRAEEDDRVKGVILRIDSPGGGVAESDTIHHEIDAFRERTGIPVVSAITGLGCSGAYYIASATDRIYAHPSALTGSIGVIGYFHRLRGLADKVGYDQIVIKSGAMKDIGNPLRDMPDEERRILQGVVDGYYDRFLKVVVDGRPGFESADKLRPVADGRVYTAPQALELKLVDRLAYLDDVVADMLDMAGVAQARVVTYTQSRSDDANIYTPQAGARVNLQGIDLNVPGLVGGMRAGFYYLWSPGAM